MTPRQKQLREVMAEKTRRIVDRQAALTLPEFLDQGQARSRQQRKNSEEPTHLPFNALRRTGASR